MNLCLSHLVLIYKQLDINNYLLIQGLMELFEPLQKWSSEVGVRYDILKTAIALSTSFLLSPIYRLFRARSSRNALSIVVGSILLIFILEHWSLLIFGGIVIPYILMSIFKHHFIITVVISFVILLYVHTYRFIFAYNVWQVDCSVYAMLLVTKITYFSKWVESSGPTSEYSFWDYLGYNLYFPGVIVGPSFSYENYLNFIHDKRKQIQKTTKYSALSPMLFAIPLIALTLYVIPKFNSRWVLQNQFYLNLNFWSKITILNLIGFLYRVKYYSAWYFAQASTNLSGLSISQTGEYNQTTAANIRFQIQPNPRNKTQYWNPSLQQWLKSVVHDTLNKKYGPNKAFFGTFLISAFWHGIYLTYYFGFLQWGILVNLTKWAYKWTLLLPKKIGNSWAFTALTWLVCSSLLNYIGMFMLLLAWQDALTFYSDIYYYGSVVLIVLLLLSFVLPPPRQKQDKRQ